nr:immunoglobulin light chain junction region [Macaca mulatta]MOW15434.1 immunoglobulin light chain junction region [Macaca mulatta]MOW15529.1 immunoglobulin light chain junction region [Macaca mulatta]MOW15827.1 immunoglobulin light chain junction region [Macaca mulatta]MOW16180.1 immunoglobulin light chain junction region [Macaca mulatta]
DYYCAAWDNGLTSRVF